MELENFLKLKKRFTEQNFAKAKRTTWLIFYSSSFLGNIFAVLFSYFFVTKLISNAGTHIPYQNVILPIFVITFLSMFELLKRIIFANIVETYLLHKKKIKTIISSMLFAAVLIIGSFYLSLSGAKEFMDKSESITINQDSIIKIKSDSVFKLTSIDLNNTQIQIDNLNASIKTRRKQIANEFEQGQLIELNKVLEKQKDNRDKKLEAIITSTKEDFKTVKNKNEKNQLAFLLLSFFIEAIILIGVSYHMYYQIKSFQEISEILDGNKNYAIRTQYLSMLGLVLNNGKVRPNENLPSFNQLKELINTNQTKKTTDKSIKDFLLLLNHLKITEIQGKKRVVICNFNDAVEKINNHLPLNL